MEKHFICQTFRSERWEVILRAISTGESDLKDCVMYGIIIVLFFRTHGSRKKTTTKNILSFVDIDAWYIPQVYSNGNLLLMMGRRVKNEIDSKEFWVGWPRPFPLPTKKTIFFFSKIYIFFFQKIIFWWLD